MSLKKILFVLLLGVGLTVGFVLFILPTSTTGGRESALSTPSEAPVARAETSAPAVMEDPLVPAAVDNTASTGPGDASRSEVDEIETGSQRTSAAENVSWLEGRVALPEGTPADERALVLSLDQAMERRKIFDDGGPALLAWKGEASSRLLDWTEMTSDGSFRIAVAPGAEHVHLAVAGRYLFSIASMQVEANASGVALAVELGGWIQGRLVAPRGVSPEQADLEGIEVEIGPDISGGFDALGIQAIAISQDTETDGDGAFEFRAVSPAYSAGLSIRPERLAATRHLGIEIQDGQRLSLDVPLDIGTSLLGSVQDEAGQPVEGAEVAARYRGPLGAAMGDLRATETDEHGQFELDNVALGDIEIVASHAGYIDGKEFLSAADLRDGGRLLGIDLVLASGASISGRVLFPDGSPSADTVVRASPDMSQLGSMDMMSSGWQTSGRATTAEDGTFEIRGLSDTRFLVRATKEIESGVNEGDWRGAARNVETDGSPIELLLERSISLRGLVVDMNQEPLPSFSVAVTLSGSGGMFGMGAERRAQDFSEREDGTFELEGLRSGLWEVVVQSAGHARSEQVELELPQLETDRLRIVLLPAAGVAGQVFDTAGQPVGGARVTLDVDLASRMEAMQAGDAPTAFTDVEGHFHLMELDPGIVLLVATLDGYAASEAVSLEVVSGQVAEGVSLHLRLGGTLTGEVMNEEGEPWPGRMVIAQRMPDFGSQRMMQSDPAGRFRAEHLEPGSWQIVATANFMEGEVAGDGDDQLGNFLSNMLMDVAEIREGEETHVVLGSPPADPVTVRGSVLHDGDPVEGSMVSFVPEGGEGISAMKIQLVDASGRYETRLDHPGAYLITVQVVTTMGEQNSVEFFEKIPDGKDEVTLDLELPVGRISGTITDTDGEPKAATRVTLHTEDGMAFGSVLGGQYAESSTDENGRYDLDFLKPGTYSVAVGGVPLGGILGGEANGGRIVEGGFDVSEGEHVEGVDFVLADPGEIVGRVVDATGTPVSEATVFVRDENGRIVERISFVVTDAGGNFTYKGLAEGSYQVLAKEGDRVSLESELVRVPAGGRGEVGVALGQGTILRVTIVDVEDLRGARVRVIGPDGNDVTGMWSLADMMEVSRNFSGSEQRVGPVPPGKYTVIVTMPDGRTSKKPVTVRGTGERKLKLRLR